MRSQETAQFLNTTDAMNPEAVDSRPPGHAGADNGGNLYCHSPAMRELMALITRAVATRGGVMIRGEDGTGRQVAARAIHATQNGSPATFVPIDCDSRDTVQLETEVFGGTARPLRHRLAGLRACDVLATRGLEHVSRNSRLHDAHGGTLYLRNVVAAPPRVQSRLARVLRDRKAVLAETGATIELDIRPMAGVDPTFDTAVQEGRVREDLLRRLSAIRIDMPPLRKRREDIPALASYFVCEICRSLRVAPKTLSQPTLSLIAALPWWGNAVELRGVLENAVKSPAGGAGIFLEDVLAHVRLDGGAAVSTGEGTLRQVRARFERDYIAAVLERHHGRVGEAARTLGIQRTNLYRKLRVLRVTRERRP